MAAIITPEHTLRRETASATAVYSVPLPVGAKFPRRSRGSSSVELVSGSNPDFTLVPAYPVGARFPLRDAQEAELRVLSPVVWEAPRNRPLVGAHFRRN